MKSKNAIIIPGYNGLFGHPNYEICLETWKFYCKKYNIDLIILTGHKSYKNVENDYAAMCFDRWVEVPSYGDYERLTFVDGDTIIRWDAYNFIEVLENHNVEVGVIPDQGGNSVANYHLNQWVPYFPEVVPYIKTYFNAGFVTLKPKHLTLLQDKIKFYKEFYYQEKDINCHVEGIGKQGGIRLDAMDQTAINLTIQELFGEELTVLPKDFNCQVPYLYNTDQDFINNYKSFDFLNKGIIFHLGSTTLAYTNVVPDFWSKFKENYI
jgi:hypothetical protein